MTRVSPVDIEAAQSVPIAAVVGQYIALNRQGFALCPFHNERSPSFHVEPKRNIAHCFGCGVTCNPITFLQSSLILSLPSGSLRAELRSRRLGRLIQHGLALGNGWYPPQAQNISRRCGATRTILSLPSCILPAEG